VAMPPMLIVIGGLPGTGKTSLATGLARALDAMYLRIDTIEQAIRNALTVTDGVAAAGYVAAYSIAEENLRLGRIVVADGVNPLAATRRAWTSIARRAGVPFFEVEVVCSDATEHRNRVERRRPDIAGLTLPTWSDVPATRFEPWTGDHGVIDTAHRSVAECLMRVHALLLAHERAWR
jgi:predicted kinase